MSEKMHPIKKYILRHKMTTNDFVELLKKSNVYYSASFINKLIRGERYASKTSAIKIAEVMGSSANEILTYEKGNKGRP